MSTRGVVDFVEDGQVVAKVYRHYDAYQLADDLKEFFVAQEKQAPGNARFDDVTMLAARYVVWQAAQYTKDPKRPLDFLGVRILNENPPDIEYVATVVGDPSGRVPKVRQRKVRLERL